MENKIQPGDLVYVVDWGKEYSEFTKWVDNQRVSSFPWQTELPTYPGKDFNGYKWVYEPNLTLKGTLSKRKPERLKEKIPVYKNFKYRVLEIVRHPKAGQYYYDTEEQRQRWGDDRYPEVDVLLLVDAATGRCHVQVAADGVSKLTPEQYKDEQFSALREYHKGRWTPDDHDRLNKEFPKELLKTLYDKDDRVLFGSNMTRGKVFYNYVPAEFMQTGRPYIINSGCTYDGKGNSDLPADTEFVDWATLHRLFTDNTFAG